MKRVRDMMNKLTDDELGLIIHRIDDPDDRESASLVCKRWLMLERQTRSSITVSNLELLPQLLTRYPNLVSFRTRKPITDSDQLKLVAKACPKLEALVLDYIDRESILEKRQEFVAAPGENLQTYQLALMTLGKVEDEGLCAVANGCPKLSKIVLKGRMVGMVGFESLISCTAHNLSHLDLSFCSCVSDHDLEAIGSCPLSFLSLQCNRLVTDAGLAFLADGSCSKTIKHLNIGSCRKITDSGVSLLRKMQVLEALSLVGCKNLTDVGGEAISAMLTLKKLNMGSLRYVTDRAIVAIAKNCLNLEKLSLNLCARAFTGEGIRSFCGHRHLEFLDLVGCMCMDKIEGYDLRRLALSCPSLVSISLEKRLRRRLCEEMSIMFSDDSVRLDCDLLRDGD